MDVDNPSYFSMPSGSTTPFDTFQRVNNRRARTFLRSVSSTSTDSELLILGEPRLSDIAPDIAAATSASNSLRSSRSTTKASDLDFDLDAESTTDQQDDEESVLISEESARYYNFNSSNNRRHSIGTFSNGVVRERTNSVASNSGRSLRDDFTHNGGMVEGASTTGGGNLNSAIGIDEHSLRHGSYPRKRCLKCSNKAIFQKSSSMDDILIVSLKSSEAAGLWVDYFSSYFQQISRHAHKKPFKIHHLGVEDVAETLDHNKICEIAQGVKLQLVVLCPNFLEFVAQNSERTSVLERILLSDRTLALLLGVSDNDVQEIHKKALPNYFQWQRQSVGQDQDETFTKEFLSQAMAILTRIWKQQSSVIAQEKSCFSVTPKKIRKGQSGVFILLTHPLQKEDLIKISIERNGEIHDIKQTKRRNPYIIKITVPENLTDTTAIVNVLVEKNGSIIGSRPIKCESKLRELEQILRSCNNPVEFMCQTFGFTPSDTEQLDNWLVQGFQRHCPPHFSLLAHHGSPFAASMQVHKHSHEEFPTLLHFAAKFGLVKLTMQLLDCPGADTANEIRNVHDMTAIEMAEENGHKDLANMLSGYMNMNEFSNMYSKLKEISTASTTSATAQDDPNGYLTPRNMEEFYKLCPKPRPVLSFDHLNSIQACKSPSSNNLVPSSSTSTLFSATPTSPLNDLSPTQMGYMSMNNPKERTESTSSDSTSVVTKVEIHHSSKDKDKDKEKDKPKKHQNKTKTPTASTNAILEDKVQKELAEIINDFKNNVHSIAQVEKLVEEWKNRNDVQKSFKEKQEQLLEMRKRYEEIQQQMKQQGRKTTPFERIKKLFRSKKEDKCTDISSPVLEATAGAPQRPISSLSTSSSGSSGRMSTISGCSLGDSGTHSDNEERKNNLLETHCEDEFRNNLNRAIMNLHYTPLPAPKPVKNSIFTNKPVFETIEEKPSRPDTLAVKDVFYIQFPPSGKPVPGLGDKKEPSENNNEYMNVSADGNPIEGSHEYMNYKIAPSGSSR